MFCPTNIHSAGPYTECQEPGPGGQGSKQTIRTWADECGDRDGVACGAQGRHWAVLGAILLGDYLRSPVSYSGWGKGEQCAGLATSTSQGIKA